MSTLDPEIRAALRALITRHRQATLAVLHEAAPLTAMVSYAEDADLSGLLIHLSALSAHKRALLQDPRCSLLIAEPDDGRAEVMSLARLAIQGSAAVIGKASDDYARSRERFLAKLPASAIMFELPDFDLLRISPTHARYVAGFGRALTVQDWRQI
jgi:hypothetical protein